jgi:surface antigen
VSTTFCRGAISPVCALSVLVAMMLAGALVELAPTATADSRTVTVDTGSGPLNVRSAPSASSQTFRTIPNKTQIVITCYMRGAAFSGGPYRLTTNLWNQLDGGGFVTDAMLDTGSNDPVVPPCGAGTPTVAMPSGRAMGRTVDGNTAPSGSCEWGAYAKWFQESGNRFYPALNGDPKDLANSAVAAGWTVVDTPQPRSIVVFQPSVDGAPPSGHVAWVDTITDRPDGQYTHIQEMDAGGELVDTWTARYVKHSVGMSYILLP